MGRAIFPTSSSGTSQTPLVKPLTIAQLKAYPPEASRLVMPDTTSEGQALIATTREGPFELHYKVYGQGPAKIVWISGHGAGMQDWYEMAREFGVRDSDQYTSLIFENRGVGQSGAPRRICSMKDLATDVKELLDHLEWLGDKRVHVVGHSMGGMIAMRLAVSYPSLIASLTLISTTSNYIRSISPLATLKTIAGFPSLLTADSCLTAMKTQGFGSQWLNTPDPAGKFPTNGDAWAAKFLTWPVYYQAAMLQTPAILGHRVAATALRNIAERLGTGRVAIVHGSSDRTIPVTEAVKLREEFGGVAAEIDLLILDGVGHIPHVERFREVADTVKRTVAQRSESNDD